MDSFVIVKLFRLNVELYKLSCSIVKFQGSKISTHLIFCGKRFATWQVKKNTNREAGLQQRSETIILESALPVFILGRKVGQLDTA